MRPLTLALLALPLLAALSSAQDDRGRLLVSASPEGTKRDYSLFLVDPSSKKVTTLLEAKGDETHVAIAVSPSFKRMVVANFSGKDRFSIRSIETPEKVQHELSGDYIWPVFLDDEHLLVGAKDGEQSVIRRVSLSSGEEVDLVASKGRIWDDVAFALSPDRKRLVYYRRGDDQRGLYLLEVDTGQERLLSKTGTFLTWSRDSTHGCLFDKNEKKLKLVSIPKGKDLSVLKDFGDGSVIGAQLGDATVLTRFLLEKGRPAGLEAIHLDGKGKETVFSTSIPLDEAALLRCFVQLRETSSFVFAEANPGAEDVRKAPRRLVRVEVKDGKAEKTVLMEGKSSIMFPISIP